MDKSKRLIASVIWLLATLLGTAHAAPFDARIKSPPAAAPEEAQARLKAHFDTFERKRQEDTPAAFVRDSAAHKQWSDLYYSITLAMDEGKPLDNLAEFGLVRKDDGTYTVDLKKFPQWMLLDSRLFIFTDPDVFEGCVPILKARGFRDSDISAVRKYLATHDPRQLMLPGSKTLADTFAARVRQRDKAGLSTDMQEARAYFYQKRRIQDEGQRQWALGLIDTLDKQRQRILSSFFDEFGASQQTYGLPSEPFDAVLEAQVATLRSGEYQKLISHEEQDIQRALADRAQELLGGQQK
jgi:hypothetical protein